MNIRTESKPGGKILVTGTIEGKRRQKTVAYDNSISKNRNHGRAAAALVNMASAAEQRRLSTAVTTVQAKWEKTLKGFVFTFPDN